MTSQFNGSPRLKKHQGGSEVIVNNPLTVQVAESL